MASPAVQTTATSQHDGSNTTSHVVSLPSGIVSGNLLVVNFCNDGNAAVTFPAGWTKFLDIAQSNDVRLSSAYRQADGTEGSTITVTTASNERSGHTAYRITATSFRRRKRRRPRPGHRRAAARRPTPTR